MTILEREIHPLLERYIPIADMIVANFGKNCEVMIHDLRNYQSSLVYVKGNVTGRKPGAPVTDVMLKQLYKQGNEIEDMLGFTTRSKDGKLIKASLSFIRDESEKVIGCIGINFDITAILSATQMLYDLSMTNDISSLEPMTQIYPKDIGEIFEDIIENTHKELGISIEEMSRSDKLSFVRQLDEKGVFLINGAIDRISDTLKVSKQTIYNYLDEIRGK